MGTPTRVAIASIIWWASSIFVSVRVKLVLGQDDDGVFPHSFALTGVMNIGVGLLAALINRFHLVSKDVPKELPALERKEWLMVLCVGCIQGVEMAFQNKSLEYLSVSDRTMLGSISVLFQIVTSRVWNIEVFDSVSMCSATWVTLGGFLQGFSKNDHSGTILEFNTYLRGVGLQFAAIFTASQRWALLQIILQSSPGSALESMSKSKWRLIQFTLPLTGCICLVFSYFWEFEDWNQSMLQETVLITILGGTLGIIALTYAELEIVRITSAVVIVILATLQHVCVASAGVIFLGESVHALTLVGFAFCLTGSASYARHRRRTAALQSAQERVHEKLDDPHYNPLHAGPCSQRPVSRGPPAQMIPGRKV